MTRRDSEDIDQSAQRKPRRGRGHRWVRGLIRMAFVLIFLAAGLAVAVVFFPLSFPLTRRAFKSRFESATGLRIDFNGARFSPTQGQILLQNPALFDPDQNEFLFEFATLEAEIDIRSLVGAVRARSGVIDVPQITILGPFQIRAEEREGQVHLTRRLERAIDLLRARREQSVDSDFEVRLSRVVLQSFNISLDRIGESEHNRILTVHDADLIAQFDGEFTPRNVLVTGQVIGNGGSAGFNAIAKPRADLDEITIELNSMPFDSRLHLSARLPLEFATGRVKLVGLLRRQHEGQWEFSSEMSLDEITLFGAGVHGVDQHFEEIDMSVRVVSADDGRALAVEDVSFESHEASLSGEGSIALVEPFEYVFEFDPLELRGQGLAMAQRAVLGKNYMAQPDRGKLRLNGMIAGEARDPIPSRLRGTIRVEDVSMTSPQFPEPIRDLMLEADFSTSTLLVRKGFGVVQGVPIHIEGLLEGRMAAGEIERATVKWQTEGEIEDLSELISQTMGEGEPRFRFKGDVVGSGTLNFEYPELTDISGMFEHAEISGELRLNGAQLTIDDFAKTLRDLRGTVTFTRNQASLRGVSGWIDDAEFRLNGTLSGPEIFWKDSRLEAQANVTLRLDSMDQYLSWFDLEAPDRFPDIDGVAKIEADVSGPLGEPRDLTYAGRVVIDQLRVPFEGFKDFGGAFEADHLELGLTDREVTLDEVKCAWGELDILAEGALTPGAGEFELKIQGDASALKENLPRAVRTLDVLKGEIFADQTLSFFRIDSEAQPAETFADLISMYQARSTTDSTSVANAGGKLFEDWDWRAPGEIRLNGVDISYETMPDSARLSSVYGRARYDRTRFWIEEPLILQVGENSRGLEVTKADILYPSPTHPSKMEFAVRGEFAYLDDWIKPWKKPAHIVSRPELSPFDPQSPLRTRIVVDVGTRQLYYKGVTGKDFTGQIISENVDTGRGRLIWRNVRAYSTKSGSVMWDGRRITTPDRSLVHHKLKFENFDVKDALAAGFEPRDDRGLASGEVTGNLELRKEGARDEPFDGSGELRIENSRFISNAVFSKLGRALNVDFPIVGRVLNMEKAFESISFSRIEGKFEVVDNAVIIDPDDPVLMENPSGLHPLSMRASGTIGPERRLGLVLKLQFLPLVRNIPLIGEVWGLLTERILRYRVTGTMDEPNVSVAAPILPVGQPDESQ